MARSLLLILAASALAVAVAVPALGAKSTAPGQQKDRPAKAPITLTGTIEKSNAGGETAYTLADGGVTYTLEAGPKWFFGAGAHPLDAYVGKHVTVVGELTAGTTDVDVHSVDGTAIRGEGKPPWAGGWKRVGSAHPGWSQEKADRFKAKFGDCFPPGQCKDKSAKPDTGDEPEGSEAPEGSESP
jgi:hypothetical protein